MCPIYQRGRLWALALPKISASLLAINIHATCAGCFVYNDNFITFFTNIFRVMRCCCCCKKPPRAVWYVLEARLKIYVSFCGKYKRHKFNLFTASGDCFISSGNCRLSGSNKSVVVSACCLLILGGLVSLLRYGALISFEKSIYNI